MEYLTQLVVPLRTSHDISTGDPALVIVTNEFGGQLTFGHIEKNIWVYGIKPSTYHEDFKDFQDVVQQERKHKRVRGFIHFLLQIKRILTDPDSSEHELSLYLHGMEDGSLMLPIGKIRIQHDDQIGAAALYEWHHRATMLFALSADYNS